MAYEVNIGWRYLYGGKHDRRMAACAIASLLISGAGLYLAVTSHGGSPAGVVTSVLGLLATAFFTLLTFFSVFATVSVLGVILAVAALTVVMSVTTGFQKQFRDKVLGVNAHVIIMRSAGDFDNYGEVLDIASKIDPQVLAVQPFIFAEMLVTSGTGQVSGVAIKGVDPQRVTRVLDLEQHMIEGTVSSLATPRDATGLPPIIMGRELARKLGIKYGDSVTVVVPIATFDEKTWKPKSSSPRTRKFRVTGIFYSGFDEYDRRLMYTSLREAQALVGKGDQVMGVELKVANVDRAKEIAGKLSRRLGEPPYQVQDWYELNHNLFTALKLQKLVLVIILTLIIIVAAVNMVSALTMMVTDKTREIAILKSMGATSSSVSRVFLMLGIAIGGVGTVIGVVIGLVTCYVVSAYGYHLDPKVYLIDRLPIDVRWFEVALVSVVTLLISLFATWAPSQAAAALRPVEGLRYD